MPTNFIIKQGDESLTSHSGLALIGALLGKTELRKRFNEATLDNCAKPKISNADIIFAMTGLICLGKPDYDAIEPFRGNPFFIKSIGLEACPSSPAIRQRIDIVGDSFNTIIKEESADLIRKTAPALTPLHTSCGDFVSLDCDVSPFNNEKTQKEGVSRTYKGDDGFAPMFSYLGQEGYLVNLELREGKQHCQKNTPEFLNQSILLSRRITDKPILVRLDSGNDSRDNIDCFIKNGVEFIIKRNLRKTDPNDWLKFAKENGESVPCRDGKKQWRGITTTNLDGTPLPCPICYEATERTIVKGQSLLFPDVNADTYWVSLNLKAGEVIDLYHDHGTSEQFHSELKTDMDLERLPSKYFKSNALILLLGMLGYNLLRLCGQESLREDNGNINLKPSHRKKASRRRIRSVILDLVYIAGRIIHSSRKWFISLGKLNPCASLFGSVYARFCTLTT
jgi:hypothetical protein